MKKASIVAADSEEQLPSDRKLHTPPDLKPPRHDLRKLRVQDDPDLEIDDPDLEKSYD